MSSSFIFSSVTPPPPGAFAKSQLQAACDGWKEAVRIAHEKEMELRVKDAINQSLKEEIEMMQRNAAHARREEEESTQLINDSVNEVQKTVTDLISQFQKLLKQHSFPSIPVGTGNSHDALDEFYFGESSFRVSPDSQLSDSMDSSREACGQRLRIIDNRLKKLLLRISFYDDDVAESEEDTQIPHGTNKDMRRSPFLDSSRTRSSISPPRSSSSSTHSSPHNSPARVRLLSSAKSAGAGVSTAREKHGVSTHAKTTNHSTKAKNGDHHAKKTVGGNQSKTTSHKSSH